MTVEEVAVYALARAMEFTSEVPNTRSLMYRRIGVRQQQLFSDAAIVNPDYWGICATGGLDQGAADLNDLVDPVEAAESITKITIEDAGTSDLVSGDEVRLVMLSDPEADLPPRATLRNRVIRGYNGELDGVTSIKIHYSRLPLPIVPTDKDRDIDIPDPHSELLVVDLTKDLLKKTVNMDAAAKTAALATLDSEEGTLLNAFKKHVREYAGSLSTRFGERQFEPRTVA